MTIRTFTFSGDNREVDKKLTERNTFSNVKFTKNVNIINPSLLMSIGSLSELNGTNYVQITDLNRYYFVNSIDFLESGFVSLNCTIDVLMSYKSDIKASTQYIYRQQKKVTPQLADPEYLIKSNRNIIIKNFGDDIIVPNNQFILTTFGKGGAGI